MLRSVVCLLSALCLLAVARAGQDAPQSPAATDAVAASPAAPPQQAAQTFAADPAAATDPAAGPSAPAITEAERKAELAQTALPEQSGMTGSDALRADATATPQQPAAPAVDGAQPPDGLPAQAPAPGSPQEETGPRPAGPEEGLTPAPVADPPEIEERPVDAQVLAWLAPDKGALISDSLFRQAAAAYRAGRLDELKQLNSDKSLAAHPLAAYSRLWELLLEARRAAAPPEKDPPIPSDSPFKAMEPAMVGRLARFVISHEDQYVAELARVQWARLAAMSLDATTFEMLYGQLVWNRDEEDLLCAHAHFTLQKDDRNKSLKAAQRVLAQVRSPELAFCRRLAESVFAYAPRWRWTYALFLMQKKRFSLTKELLHSTPPELLPVDRSELLSVLDNPRRWFEKNRLVLRKQPARLLVFAALRLAAVDTVLAAAVADATQGRITPHARAMLWGRIGYTASVDLKPVALDYYRKAGEALGRAHSDPVASLAWDAEQLQLWYARAALRYGSREELLKAVGLMSERLRKEPAWIYWRAIALRDLGRNDQAQPLFASIADDLGFYGLLACDALGRPYPFGDKYLDPALNRRTVAQFDNAGALARAQAFYRLEMYREGHREWNWFMRTLNSTERRNLAEYAGLRGITHRQIFTSLRSRRPVYSQVFPLAHRQEVETAARAADLSPAWIFGVIHQESRFMRFVQSAAGAQGLMQVMPKTARWVAQRIALQNYADGELMRIQTNLLIGSQYLKIVHDSVSGNAAMTTASYNAGPARAQLWRAALTAPVSGAAFTETIPYGETREYVKRVAANVVYYSRYYPNPLRLSDILGEVAPQRADANPLP